MLCSSGTPNRRTHKHIRPEVSYQHHCILSYLKRMFPTLTQTPVCICSCWFRSLSTNSYRPKFGIVLYCFRKCFVLLTSLLTECNIIPKLNQEKHSDLTITTHINSPFVIYTRFTRPPSTSRSVCARLQLCLVLMNPILRDSFSAKSLLSLLSSANQQ